MLLNSLRQTVNEGLLRFLWRQWSQLGVAGGVEFRDTWLIDPEALIIFTMRMGRYDPRLFDEVIDWTVRNGRWISLQRLKNIAERADDETRQALSAFASVIDSHDTRPRWRSIMKLFSPAAKPHPAPFFLEANGEPLPLVGEMDEFFHSRRLERSRVVLRNLSVSVPMSPPTNLLFKLRSLFGLAPRAEVVAYLMAHSGGKASVIARSTVYSYPPINEALAELAQSGLVYQEQRGFYSTDTERWQRFLEMAAPSPSWIDWPRVFAALSALDAFLAEVTKRPISDYLLNSRSVTLNDTLRDMLSNTELSNPFLRPMALDGAVEQLTQRTEELVSMLNTGSSEAKAR